LHDKYAPESTAPQLKTNISQFIDILTQWKQLVEKDAQKITITEQDGHITIEGD